MTPIRTLTWIALILVASAASGADAQKERRYAQVIISVFSGVPDPHFEMNRRDMVELERLLAKLPVDRTPRAEPVMRSHLGYRGLTIDEIPAAGSGEHRTITIYRTAVEVRSFSPTELKKQVTLYRDDSKTVETWVIGIATRQKVIEPGLGRQILSDRR